MDTAMEQWVVSLLYHYLILLASRTSVIEGSQHSSCLLALLKVASAHNHPSILPASGLGMVVRMDRKGCYTTETAIHPP